MIFFFSTLVLVALFLEGFVTTAPLVLMALILSASFGYRGWVFAAAFVAGLLLDVWGLRQIGQTSIFFLAVMLAVFLYQRKFELHTIYFVIAATGAGSLAYLLFFGFGQVILQTICMMLISAIIFIVGEKLFGKEKSLLV